jgi:protein phosphatase 2C family protein 2/3
VNVGDSRAIISADRGRKVIQISQDHKPNEFTERKRIIEAGGSVYQ